MPFFLFPHQLFPCILFQHLKWPQWHQVTFLMAPFDQNQGPKTRPRKIMSLSLPSPVSFLRRRKDSDKRILCSYQCTESPELPNHDSLNGMSVTPNHGLCDWSRRKSRDPNIRRIHSFMPRWIAATRNERRDLAPDCLAGPPLTGFVT